MYIAGKVRPGWLADCSEMVVGTGMCAKTIYYQR